MMFSLPTKLAIGAVLFLIISGALYGIKRSYDNGIRATQLAADQAAVTAAQGNTAICKASNVSLQDSIDVIEKDRVRQNDAVLLWQANTREAFAISDFWKGKYQATQAALTTQRNDAHAKGLRPAVAGQTNEQMCAEIDADKGWLPEREARMRDILGLPVATPDAVRVK